MAKRLKIGVTIGDINGIGPEVVLKSLHDTILPEKHTFIIYGSARALKFHDKIYFEQPTKFYKTNYVENIKEGLVNIINVDEAEIKIQLGEPSAETGQLALKSLEAATQDLVDDKLDILVTAPLNKSTIKPENGKFTGQTEFIAAKAGAKNSVMMMCDDKLRVALVTNHMPMRMVPEKITVDNIINKIKILDDCLKKDFLIDRPKIAVLGLNPHAGDYGLLGSEETEIISPAINKAKDMNILAMGPYSADGLFGSGMFTHFDAVLAMYHDQGLVPFKAISFDSGVNYTAGLPVIRTSPDHGTAYEIAGKGEASIESFLHAVYTAIDISKNRNTYAEITSNPMKKALIEVEK